MLGSGVVRKFVESPLSPSSCATELVLTNNKLSRSVFNVFVFNVSLLQIPGELTKLKDDTLRTRVPNYCPLTSPSEHSELTSLTSLTS